MDIKEYYRRIYKKEWEDVDSNKRLIFTRQRKNNPDAGSRDSENGVNEKSAPDVPLSKKMLYYASYAVIPLLLIPLCIWVLDFLGAAVIVVISDMETPIKLALLTVQAAFTILVVISARIIIQRVFFKNKQ